MKRVARSTQIYPRAVLCLPALAIGAASIAFGATHQGERGEISVYRQHYVTGGRSYADLDQLEAAVRATRPAFVRIVSCEPEAARAWLAAVPRFDSLPLQLDVIDASSPACRPAAMPAGASQAIGPTGIDGSAVAKYWEQRMP